MELPRCLAVCAGRQLHLRERIGGVRVASELRHQDVGLEALDQRRDDGAERVQPRVVAGERRQRHVHRAPLRARSTAFGQTTRPWEEPRRVLVDRDRQHTRVVVEDELHAIAVMDVDVDVGDPLGACLEQPRDRDRRIVVHTEPRGPLGHRVMKSTRRVERVLHIP